MSPLKLSCPSAEALSGLLQQAGDGATLLIPESPEVAPTPFQPTDLQIELPTGQLVTACEVLQVLQGAGVVVRLIDPAGVQRFAGRADSSGGAAAPQSPDEQPEILSRPRRTSAEVQSVGTTPLSWPIERLRSDWHTISQPDRIRVARYGKRPARNLVLKSNDKQLMVFLLQNTRITADEVAVMAGMTSLDPDLLRRIAASSEWTRHTAVARNLVCHPKLPANMIKKLVDKLPLDELRRLARGGRVRASTKQMIMRRVDRGR